MTPSGTICICANTNLKYQSEDTIVFASESAKRTFFDSKVIKTFTDQMYTRGNTNGVNSTLNGKLYVAPGTSSIKVNCPIGQIYNADYMFYVDNGYSGKTFYNFITDVSYVSDEVTQITFTEDVFMTWHNNISINHSFVERETVNSDTIFENKLLETVVDTELMTYRKSYLANSRTNQPWLETTSLGAGYIVIAVKRFRAIDNTGHGQDAYLASISGSNKQLAIPSAVSGIVYLGSTGTFTCRYLTTTLDKVLGVPQPYAYFVFPMTSLGYSKCQQLLYYYTTDSNLSTDDIVASFIAPSTAVPTDVVLDVVNNNGSYYLLLNDTMYDAFNVVQGVSFPDPLGMKVYR